LARVRLGLKVRSRARSDDILAVTATPKEERGIEPWVGWKKRASLGFVLNPPSGLSVATIVGLGFVLGLLHGATPDEHTWPITFSYAVGSFTTSEG
jgi:hypothetical protein